MLLWPTPLSAAGIEYCVLDGGEPWERERELSPRLSHQPLSEESFGGVQVQEDITEKTLELWVWPMLLLRTECVIITDDACLFIWWGKNRLCLFIWWSKNTLTHTVGRQAEECLALQMMHFKCPFLWCNEPWSVTIRFDVFCCLCAVCNMCRLGCSQICQDGFTLSNSTLGAWERTHFLLRLYSLEAWALHGHNVIIDQWGLEFRWIHYWCGYLDSFWWTD